jgi:nucleotide-binding universal stress UspA family protein
MRNREEWLKQRLHTILLATDFHQNSRLALNYAAKFAHFFESELVVLNAFEFGPYGKTVEVVDHVPSRERQNAEEALAKFVQGARIPDVLTEAVVVEGFVPSAVIKALSKRSVGLLVIGTEGMHKGLDHFLLGSNTEALILGSNRLTLAVGPHIPQTTEDVIRFQKIIYIADLSVASTAAATYALALSQAFAAEVEIYQLASKAAKKDPSRLKKTAAQYCEVLRFVDPDLPAQWFDYEFQLSRIVPEAELMARVSEPSNLIVLGVQAASFLQRHLHTSLAYRLLTEAVSPVLTVPAEAVR